VRLYAFFLKKSEIGFGKKSLEKSAVFMTQTNVKNAKAP
jgi:hypothetical protein